MNDTPQRVRRRQGARVPLLCSLLWVLLAGQLCPAAWAQTAEAGLPGAEDTVHVAPVVIDGETLFLLRGVTAYPAEQRAAIVRDRIIAAARDPAITGDAITVVEADDQSQIFAGRTMLLGFFDADAALEQMDRQTLAGAYRDTIANAIAKYRTDRSSTMLVRRSAFALAATLVAGLLLWGTLKVFDWLDRWTSGHVERALARLGDRALPLVHGGQIWALMGSVSRLARILVLLLFAYFYLNTVLGLYPWTRPAANLLLSLVLDPLQSMWRSLLGAIPGLVFLALLYFLVRYLLKITRAFFDGVALGRIRLADFDPEWAEPTYKILRFLFIIGALVVAYPYIPGSDSLAFKGMSVFLGVLLSLGSSSFIANVIAGVMMTYRGAFKVGDRVQIGDTVGTVEEIRLMITRVLTAKNEVVVIPNSNILETNIVNYSVYARREGVILHTTIGIGYDVPWRQVEALLLLAAERTAGLKREPPPFVRQSLLGDFAVNYEINAYCGDAQAMNTLYSQLHANIQDVFNEHGVQIMSPAYESDPPEPKVVPPENWYAAPALRPEAGG